jgi:membrane protein DedA with SNARE-associated domain
MMTTLLIAAGAGALLGTALGFKLGRGYERLWPRRPESRQKQ